jgi:ribosomal protein S6--L-glutamate ligase
MKRRACILGEPTGWHAKRLADLLARRGLEPAIVTWQSLTADVTTTGTRFGPSALATANVVAVRGMPGTSPPESRLEEVIFRMDVLGRIAASGTPVVNPPRALEIAIDKYLSLAVLAGAGLPVPRTLVVQNAAGAVRAWDALGGDCVVKPLFGSRGRGIGRCQSAEAVTAAVASGNGVTYLQEFVPHGGWDVRALVIGEQVFAMRRDAPPGHWVTNLACGGTASSFSLPVELADMARRAAAAVGATLAGIDLLPATDGRILVLEVNAVPGWRGIETVAGEIVGAAVADHVAALAALAQTRR